MGARILATVVGTALLFGIVGCGGGGGGSPVLPGADIDLEPAMAVLLAADPDVGCQTCQDALDAWEGNGPPQDRDALEAELEMWVQLVAANPEDSACQLGLALTILAAAIHNAGDFLGYDIFEELNLPGVTAMAFSEELSPSSFVTDALMVATLKSIPQLRGGAAPVRPAADAPPGVPQLQVCRVAVKEYLLGPLANCAERLASVADNADPATRLLALEVNSNPCSLYGADFHALAATTQLIRCAALMVSSVDPNYGWYAWDLTMAERDVNDDGILTVLEYAPHAPFANIDGPEWSQAGGCLRDGVDRLWQAIEQRQVADSDEAVNQVLADEDPGELQTYLEDVAELLGGQVDVTVEYGMWPANAGTETQVPLNLRELWDNPSYSFRDLLPPLVEDPPDSGDFKPDMDSLPDDTFSGVFPDPDAIRSIVEGGYDRISVCYGSFCIGADPWLP